MRKFPSRERRSISRADRRALARLRLRDAMDGFCGINHAVRMARYAGITESEIAQILGRSEIETRGIQ